MNKALWAIIAAAALGATKKATSKGNIGSFNELTDKDVFDLVGRLNGIKSFEDFMEMTKDERELLKIQAGFIINEASSNPNSILAQGKQLPLKTFKERIEIKASEKIFKMLPLEKQINILNLFNNNVRLNNSQEQVLLEKKSRDKDQSHNLWLILFLLRWMETKEVLLTLYT